MAGAIGVRVSVVPTTPVLLGVGRVLKLRNRGTDEVYLGGSTVTSATGAQFLTTDGWVEVDATVDALYAVCAAAESATLEVLATRRGTGA